MSNYKDPRMAVTHNLAMEAALKLLQEKGVLAVTHGAVSTQTGISRSTLYRHWPKLEQLRNDAFLMAATSPESSPRTNGPLRTDLTWILSKLMTALNETPWGQVAPQVVAIAATDEQARKVINDFMKDRMSNVEEVFAAAEARGELRKGLEIGPLIEMVIAVPYFRKLIAGLPLDDNWRDVHVDQICRLATGRDVS